MSRKEDFQGPSNIGAGLLAPGTILNLYNRLQTAPAPEFVHRLFDKNIQPGSQSTTYSKSWNAQEFGPEAVAKYGKDAEILLPTVVNGKFVTVDEARDLFSKGQHLGVFKDWQSADKYSEALHKSQGEYGDYYGAKSVNVAKKGPQRKRSLK
jgi:hypothetical protein